MGVICARSKDDMIESTLLNYEKLCTDIEERLLLHKLNIRDLRKEVNSMKNKNHQFLVDDLIQLYENHGIPRKDFAENDSIYQDFFPGLSECDLCEEYLLSTALPVCDGGVIEKKEILWEILHPELQRINRKNLRRLVKMIIALSVKTIPVLVLRSTIDGIEYKEITTMVQSNDNSVKMFANKCYLNEIKNKEKPEVSKYEYESWMLRIEASRLFVSSNIREDYLKFLQSYEQ